MLPYRDTRITKVIIIVFFLAIAAYAYFEARGILYGPTISIVQGESTVHDPYVIVRGKASHIVSLMLDGQSVPVTKDGAFEIPYLLAPGTNHLFFTARDTYGGQRDQTIEIMYIPSATSSAPMPQSTTTPNNIGTKPTPHNDATSSSMSTSSATYVQ